MCVHVCVHVCVHCNEIYSEQDYGENNHSFAIADKSHMAAKILFTISNSCRKECMWAWFTQVYFGSQYSILGMEVRSWMVNASSINLI